MPQTNNAGPNLYLQPIIYSGHRILNNEREDVEYISQSRVRIWYNNQNENYSSHHHDALEVIICKEHPYSVKANGREYHLEVGDILFIPPHMLHELSCVEGGTRFICLFNIDFLRSFHDFHMLNPVFINAYLCNATSCPTIYQSVYAAFMNIIDTYFSNALMWESKVFSQLLQIFSLIGTNHFETSAKSDLEIADAKPRIHYEKITAVLNYIDENYASELTLEQAANYIGFSKYHFSRLFKQYTSSTFYDYLSHKRIQIAQSMLSSDLPITDIAFQSGFNNLTTFCRCFKKYTDCSPTEFRNHMTETHEY